jgi:hypothetical protein
MEVEIEFGFGVEYLIKIKPVREHTFEINAVIKHTVYGSDQHIGVVLAGFLLTAIRHVYALKVELYIRVHGIYLSVHVCFEKLFKEYLSTITCCSRILHAISRYHVSLIVQVLEHRYVTSYILDCQHAVVCTNE